MMRLSKTGFGLLLGLLSYVLWGGLVYYWHLLAGVNSVEVFCYRIVFTVLSMLLYFLVMGRVRKLGSEMAGLVRSRRSFGLALLASVFLGINWVTFIYSVAINEATQASIANFIMPLVSIVLAVIFLREHLARYMWVALGVAAVGVVWMIAGSGRFPLLTIVMSVCFPIYGLLKKYYRLSSDVAMVFESLVLLPFVLVYLVGFAQHGLWQYDAWTIVGLALSGPVTAAPLLLFAESLRRAPLHLVSFIQYVNPTIALIISVTALAERLSGAEAVSLIFIWAGILIFLIGEVVSLRRHHRAMNH